VAVKRIVTNIAADRVSDAHKFYVSLLNLEVVMDDGWIVTFACGHSAPVQLSVASEGGSGTPVPDLSIEVDDIDAIYGRAMELGFEIAYALTDEPWGVRRFYVRDPFGKLVNILTHTERTAANS
jgi:uncharacterized glyoxalase superfamily protein PhnB